MNKLNKIALVIFACALLLGAGGALLTGEGDKDLGSIDEMVMPALSVDHGAAAFCDPRVDPGCMPPKYP